MEFTETEIRSGTALGAPMPPATAAHLLAESNLRIAIGIAGMAGAALLSVVTIRQPLAQSSFGALRAIASSLHSSWSSLYATALPCPAGRPSGCAIRIWARYILDCYFPGIRQWLAKVREKKGSRPGELILA
jgi:hypothetical protein